MPQSSMSKERPARRSSIIHTACQYCREKRAKCDGSHPCRRCENRQLTCHYEPRTWASKRSLRDAADQYSEQVRQRECVLDAVTKSAAGDQVLQFLKEHGVDETFEKLDILEASSPVNGTAPTQLPFTTDTSTQMINDSQSCFDMFENGNGCSESISNDRCTVPSTVGSVSDVFPGSQGTLSSFGSFSSFSNFSNFSNFSTNSVHTDTDQPTVDVQPVMHLIETPVFRNDLSLELVEPTDLYGDDNTAALDLPHSSSQQPAIDPMDWLAEKYQGQDAPESQSVFADWDKIKDSIYDVRRASS